MSSYRGTSREFFDILVDAVARGKDGSKYDELAEWLFSIGTSGRAAHMGDIHKDYQKSVGQVLALLPEVIVLLSPESFNETTDGKRYVDKLCDLGRYASGLQAVVACQGRDSQWDVEYLVGRTNSPVLVTLRSIFPEARVQHI